MGEPCGTSTTWLFTSPFSTAISRMGGLEAATKIGGISLIEPRSMAPARIASVIRLPLANSARLTL